LEHLDPFFFVTFFSSFLSKILTLRLLADIISGSQSAFIKGRRITDNILIANELVRNFHLSSGAANTCLKVDLRKAYDSVNRQFLYNQKKPIFPSGDL